MKCTIVDLFNKSVQEYRQNTFLMEKVDKAYTSTSYGEVYEKVVHVGAGLSAIGVQKGDHIALLSEGCNMWVIAELGMFFAGAVNVPLSIKLEESNDLLFRLVHGEVKYIMVSKSQLPKIRAIRHQLPHVKQVVVLNQLEEWQEGEISIHQLMAQGKAHLKNVGEKNFMAISESLQNDDPATITYTSGTTADPKGVILTHRNYTANVEQSLTLVQVDQHWRTLIILPLDHCFAHVVGFYIMMAVGATVATTQVGRSPMETLRNIPLNIKEVRPHFILSVPALAKSFKKNIEKAIQAQGPTAVRLFELGMKVRQTYFGDSNLDAKGWRVLLKPLVSLFDQIIFSKVRANFGGELRFFIGGGALLDKDLQKFYVGIGIPMYQGYGLSEATPVISSNGPTLYRFGSSGRLVKPIELRICDDEGRELPQGQQGEIVVKGENVMAGYWNNPEATADTLRNGYLHTGDLGYINKEGLLYVKGRFKSLLISSDGEKYSPEGIEEAMVEKSPLIDQVMLYNNQSAYTTALLVPNREQLNHRLKDLNTNLSSKEGREAALKMIEKELARFRKGGDLEGLFPERWLPSAFAVLPEPFTEQNHMINSTLKMVRGKIEKAYAERIDYLYTADGKRAINPPNIEALT